MINIFSYPNSIPLDLIQHLNFFSDMSSWFTYIVENRLFTNVNISNAIISCVSASIYIIRAFPGLSMPIDYIFDGDGLPLANYLYSVLTNMNCILSCLSVIINGLEPINSALAATMSIKYNELFTLALDLMSKYNVAADMANIEVGNRLTLFIRP